MTPSIKGCIISFAASLVLLAGCGTVETLLPERTGPDLPDYSNIPHGITRNSPNTGVPAGQLLTDVKASITVTESWIADQNGGLRILENRNF